jgi:hypothetical protein
MNGLLPMIRLQLLLLILVVAATGCGAGSDRANEEYPSATTVETRVFSIDEVVREFAAVEEEVELIRGLDELDEGEYNVGGDATVPLPHSGLTPPNEDRFDYFVYLYGAVSDAATAERSGGSEEPITGEPVNYLRVANVLVMVANDSQKRATAERALDRLAASPR